MLGALEPILDSDLKDSQTEPITDAPVGPSIVELPAFILLVKLPEYVDLSSPQVWKFSELRVSSSKIIPRKFFSLYVESRRRERTRGI